MTFDYNTLKKMARSGDRLGNWNSKPVFSCSTSELNNKGNGAYYILYDDDNKIVGKDGKFYYSYGTVTEQGSVSEYSSRRRYNVGSVGVAHDGDYKINAAMKSAAMPQSEPVPAATVAVTYVPGYAVDERPVGDVKATIDVEATLKKAREMTIDDLLDGFMDSVMAVG